MENNLTLQISISDARKAFTALRSYGLKDNAVKEILQYEIAEIADYYINDAVEASRDYRIIPKSAISPELIEFFGEQHIKDALSYSYLFMNEYEIAWPIYKTMLIALLEVFRPEELILNPENIRIFIKYVLSDLNPDDLRFEENVFSIEKEKILKLFDITLDSDNEN